MSKFFQLALLACLAIIVLAPVAPANMPIPGRDEGVFLYVGQQIVDGAVPYRDVWDHKGPLIYYLNALGLVLSGSAWGVWWIEVVFLLASAALGYASLCKLFGEPAALAASLLWLAGLQIVLDGGNTVEELSLLFEFGAIQLFLRTANHPRHFWNEFLIGVCAALAFTLRPNNIGYYLGIGLLTIASAAFSPTQRTRILQGLATMILGGLGVLGLVAAYFAWQKALPQLYDVLFVYNSIYSQQSLGRRAAEKMIASMLYGFERLEPYSLVGAAGLAVAAGYIALKTRKLELVSWFGIFLLVTVPAQLTLSVMSGRQYLHYYTAWLPALAFLGGFAFFGLKSLIEKLPISRAIASSLVLIPALALTVLPFAQGLPALWQLTNPRTPNYSSTSLGPYLEYIENHVSKNDRLLIWGNQATIHFLTARKAPGRFVYTYALGSQAYFSPALADEFLNDIIREKPIIIDATPSDKTTSGIYSPDWKGYPLTRNIVKYIEQNYALVTEIGPAHWRVWVYKEP